LLGPFEEEEEGTGIASDVVKVKGEDPATPGLLPQGIDPGTVTKPQYRYNKTKQYTLPIRECARGFINRGQSRPIINTIHVTDRLWPHPFPPSL